MTAPRPGRRLNDGPLCVPLVPAAKHCRKTITPPIPDERKATLREAAARIGRTAKEITKEEEHVHLLPPLPADMGASSTVNSLESASFRMIFKKHPNLLQDGMSLLWPLSYFSAAAGRVSTEALKRSVEFQETRGRHSFPPSENEHS